MSTKIVGFNSLGGMNAQAKRYAGFKRLWAERAKQSVPGLGKRARDITQWLVGPLAVALITEFFMHGPAVNATTVGFSYLLAILIASAFLEFRIVFWMCVAATVAYDYYFLPPVGTLNINDPQDWVALFSFLVTALIGSELAAKSRRRAEEATRRRTEAERLYKLSNRLLTAGRPADLFDQIPGHVAASFGLDSAALYLAETREVFCSQHDLSETQSHQLEQAASFEHAELATKPRSAYAPIRSREVSFGSLALFGPLPSIEAIDATAALVGVAIDRARAIEQVAKIEAARENERLKSVLLDAITHDFRTPLTSIKVSATGLLDDLDFDREQRKELLVIINEECDRMSNLVGEASEMARLEAGDVNLDRAPHTVRELISCALEDCRNFTSERNICLDLKRPEQTLSIDLHLSKKVLVHLLSNAHLYSSAGQSLTIRTDERNGFAWISVCDRGPGIGEDEIGPIFEKFYRGKEQRYRVQGTGMGLPIAKAIVEAHGGTLSVKSRVGHGSVFTFNLPVEG